MPLRRRFLLYAPSNSITLQKVVPESFEFVPEHTEGVRRAARYRARGTRGAVLHPRYALRELFRALSTSSLVIIPLKYLLSPFCPPSVDFNEARRASGDEIEMHLAPCFGPRPPESTRSSQVRASSEITPDSHAASGELDPARWRPFHEDHQRLPQLFQPDSIGGSGRQYCVAPRQARKPIKNKPPRDERDGSGIPIGEGGGRGGRRCLFAECQPEPRDPEWVVGRLPGGVPRD